MNIKNKSIYLLTPLIACLGYFYFYEYFELLILQRLQGDDIDNRTSYEVTKFVEKAWASGELWLGHQASFLSSLGFYSGIKAPLIRHGILGTGSLILAYTIIYLRQMKKYNKKVAYLFLIAFWGSFYQREYIDRIEFLMIFFSMYALLGNYDNNVQKQINIR